MSKNVDILTGHHAEQFAARAARAQATYGTNGPDFVQEAYVDALRVDDIDPARVDGLITTVTKRRGVDFLRSYHAKHVVTGDAFDLVSDTIQSDDQFGQPELALERKRRFSSTICTLLMHVNSSHLDMLVEHEIDGESFDAIAKRRDKSLHTIISNVARLKKTARTLRDEGAFELDDPIHRNYIQRTANALELGC